MKFGNCAALMARLAAVLLATALAGCGQGQQQGAAQNLPAVTVAKPVQRTVVDQDEYVGRFVAVSSVDMRSRLFCYLAAIHFIYGLIVKVSDCLLTFDRQPFL